MENIDLGLLKRQCQNYVDEIKFYSLELKKARKEIFQLIRDPYILSFADYYFRVALKEKWECPIGVLPDPPPGDAMTLCFKPDGEIKNFFYNEDYRGFNRYTAPYRKPIEYTRFIREPHFSRMLTTIRQTHRDKTGKYHRLKMMSCPVDMEIDWDLRMKRCECGIFCYGKILEQRFFKQKASN